MVIHQQGMSVWQHKGCQSDITSACDVSLITSTRDVNLVTMDVNLVKTGDVNLVTNTNKRCQSGNTNKHHSITTSWVITLVTKKEPQLIPVTSQAGNNGTRPKI